jgi:hypothetical protein
MTHLRQIARMGVATRWDIRHGSSPCRYRLGRAMVSPLVSPDHILDRDANLGGLPPEDPCFSLPVVQDWPCITALPPCHLHAHRRLARPMPDPTNSPGVFACGGRRQRAPGWLICPSRPGAGPSRFPPTATGGPTAGSQTEPPSFPLPAPGLRSDPQSRTRCAGVTGASPRGVVYLQRADNPDGPVRSHQRRVNRPVMVPPAGVT